MNFQDSIKSCFKNYGKFKGRASRSEYWYWALFVSLVSIFTIIIDISLLGSTIDDNYTPLNSIWSLVVIIPGITVTVRRLHDVNRSGWWIFIVFTIIGLIPYFYWLVKKGDATDNNFGPSSLKFKVN